jgi:tripartite-type tricarboxylate transporter receptor subunit TctC
MQGFPTEEDTMKSFVVRLFTAAVVTTLFAFATQSSVVAAAFPEKGKVINWIVPSGAGGGSDMTARLMKPGLEKALGVTVVIINKPGGGGIVGIAELVKSKPDGYTIGVAQLPTLHSAYLDPSRGAPFGRKDFKLVANIAMDPCVSLVPPSSRFKTIVDLVKEAKANPLKIKVTTAGIMSTNHIAAVQLGLLEGAHFSVLFYDQQGEQRAALLGGHADVEFNNVADGAKDVASGQMRALGVWDAKRSKYMPNVPTYKEQGVAPSLPVLASARGIFAPAGTPDNIVAILADATKKALADPETVSGLEKTGVGTQYMSGKEYEDAWAAADVSVKQVLEIVQAGQKK